MANFFQYPWLLVGLAALAIPILIHLINLLRHRRVQWGAMEFLLASQRKNSTWVRLKELLLLLLRLAAFAAVVLMAAGPLLRNQWAALLGGSRTHHIVLLDDSFSTSDRWSDTSAFDEGKQFVQKLANQAARHGQPQTFTLLRFSQAARPGRSTQPDLFEELVTSDFTARAATALEPLKVSETAVGPETALEAIDQLVGDGQSETRVVYLVSDLRRPQWGAPEGLAKHLERLSTAGAQLKLVHTVDAARDNLAVSALAPVSGVRAAGVPFFMEVSVRNFGTQPARNVNVLLEEDGQERAGTTIEEVPPGKSETRRFPVVFPTAGEHELSARIEGDIVAADNRRFAVLTLPLEVPVLIVDGSDGLEEGRLLSVALAPGGSVRTGIAPQVEPPHFLNRQTAATLAKYRAILLCNVPRFDAPAIEALEAYVRAGGGAAFFLGEDVNERAYNDTLHRDGEGIFPVPLALKSDLAPDPSGTAIDLEVSDHPVFHIFTGERNSFLALVKIDRYFTVASSWRLEDDNAAQLVARLRNGAPLAFDRPLGDGRTLTFLTTAGPAWNNWARNPSYVVALLELVSYLGSARVEDPSHLVSTPLELRLNPAEHQPRVRFFPPGEEAAGGVALIASPDAGGLSATFAETDAAGIYQAHLTTARQEQQQVRRFAYNVDPDEGDLATVTGEQLAASLPGVRFEYLQAADFTEKTERQEAGFNLSDAVLYLLIAVLLAEQVLAYFCSYHPAKGAAR
jgi:hypothetical protein